MKYMLDEITKIKSICVLYLLFPFLVFWARFESITFCFSNKVVTDIWRRKILLLAETFHVLHQTYLLSILIGCSFFVRERKWFWSRYYSVSCRAGFSWIFPLLTSPPLLDPLSWLRHLYRSVAAKTLEVDHHSVNLSSPCVFKLFDSWIGNFIMFSSSYANITLLRSIQNKIYSCKWRMALRLRLVATLLSHLLELLTSWTTALHVRVLMQPFEAVVVTDVVTDSEKFNIDFLAQIFSWLPYMYRNS